MLAVVPMDTPTGRVAKWFADAGPVTLAQAVERGAVKSLRLREKTVQTALDDLVFFGWFDCAEGIYTITGGGRRMLNPPPECCPQLVPPRVVNRFTPPISARYLPSPLGMRPGSNDYRAIPSRHLPHGA